MLRNHNGGEALIAGEALKNIDFLVVIAGRKLRKNLLAEITQSGGRLLNIIYGKGSVKSSYLIDAFGLVPEENKVVITCLLPMKKSDKMIKMLTEKFNFDKPNTGIAFTIPVDELSF
jgi:hypothetical protein